MLALFNIPCGLKTSFSHTIHCVKWSIWFIHFALKLKFVFCFVFWHLIFESPCWNNGMLISTLGIKQLLFIMQYFTFWHVNKISFRDVFDWSLVVFLCTLNCFHFVSFVWSCKHIVKLCADVRMVLVSLVFLHAI